jgi:hypothetical protein
MTAFRANGIAGDRGAEPLREMKPLCRVSNTQTSTNSPLSQWVVILAE